LTEEESFYGIKFPKKKSFLVSKSLIKKKFLATDTTGIKLMLKLD
jgi:hypothetical protein